MLADQSDCVGGSAPLGNGAAHALAPKLPNELVRLVMAHRAASVVQRCVRRRLGRRVRTAVRRARRVAQQERAMWYIGSFAFGGVPMPAWEG
jgi:hypothetical protein